METFGQTTTLKELQDISPFLPWEQFFHTLLSAEGSNYKLEPTSTLSIIGGIQYFGNLSVVIQEAGLDVLEPYLVWRSIQSLKSYAPKVLREVFAPLDEKLTGASSKIETPRSDLCLDVLKNHMGDAVGKWFVQETFRGESFAEAKVMMEGIKKAFASKLNTYEWLDDLTRLEAMKKIDDLYVGVGYPPALDNATYLADVYGKLEPREDEFLSSVVEAIEVSYAREIANLEKAVDRTIVEMPIAEVNAQYVSCLDILDSLILWLEYN
jgi:predicted metalloendopeptidase